MTEKRKKIFLLWSGTQKEAVQAIGLLKKRGYETVYWLSGGDPDLRIPGTVFHHSMRARAGEPASGIDPFDFPPPDAALIRKLYKTEALTMTIMNRRVESYTVDQKKRLYYENLRYWQGVFNLYKPDFIFLTTYPHNITSFVAYSLARIFDIPIYFINETALSDRIIIQRDYEETGRALREAINRNINKKWNLADLSPDLRHYYDSQTIKDNGITPHDLKIFSIQFNSTNLFKLRLKIFFRSIKDFSLPRKIFRFTRRMFGDNLKKEYERVQGAFDLNKKFIYAPLHLQPEGSTSPLGDMFVDQTLQLEILSSALPDGWLIYVKENPYQWMVGGTTDFSYMRYKGYYEKIARLKGVRIVPIETSTFTLINHSEGVAIVTSRAALEAIFRGKPVIVFGYPWFMDAPGLLKVEGPESAKSAFTQIQAGFKASHQELVNFLKSLDEVSVRGFIEPVFSQKNSAVSAEESVRRAINLLINEVEREVEANKKEK
ncbi:MAG: hypothetical protein Q7S34_03690 [bacterium]|nr:hypothetical protein [bacterium]